MLLVNGGGGRFRPRSPDAELSLDQWAEAFGRKVVVVGSVTVLPPNTMQVIALRPGTPDPYAKLKPEERLKVLLSLFSEDQWKLAGSPSGIGRDDLNENQRLLFNGLVPEKIGLQKSLLVRYRHISPRWRLYLSAYG